MKKQFLSFIAFLLFAAIPLSAQVFLPIPFSRNLWFDYTADDLSPAPPVNLPASVVQRLDSVSIVYDAAIRGRPEKAILAHTYNKSGLVIQDLMTTYEQSMLQGENTRIDYQYTGNRDLSLVNHFEYSPSSRQWYNDSRTVCQYTSNGLPSSCQNEILTDDKWEKQNSSEIIYNSDDQILEQIGYMFSKQSIRYGHKFKYPENRSDLTQHLLSFRLDTVTKAWRLQDDMIYQYDEQERLISKKIITIDTVNNPAIGQININYTYSDAGQKTEVVTEMITTPGIIAKERQLYQYDEFNNLYAFEYQFWDNDTENWEVASRQLISYNNSYESMNLLVPVVYKNSRADHAFHHMPTTLESFEYKNGQLNSHFIATFHFSKQDYRNQAQNEANHMDSEIRLTPNPASDYVMLQGPVHLVSADIEILDQNGRSIIRRNIQNGGRLDLAPQLSGNYSYLIWSNNTLLSTGTLLIK